MSEAQIAAVLAAIGLVTGVVGFLKPFVEVLPFARPGSALHDPTLRALNVALNLAVVLAMAATFGSLSLADWLNYLLLASGQAVGSHVLFSVTNNTAAAAPASSAAPALAATGLNAAKLPLVEPVPVPAAVTADAPTVTAG